MNVALLPDGSAIPSSRVLVGIHQDSCDSLIVVTRGIDRDDETLRRSFSVRVGDAAGETQWEDGAIVQHLGSRSNLPPPIAMAARGDWTWSLRRERNKRDLRYESGYRERGLFLALPYSAHVEVSCALRAHEFNPAASQP